MLSFSEPMGLKALLEILEITILSHSEIQKLVDVLLDKQKSAEQWKKVSLLGVDYCAFDGKA